MWREGLNEEWEMQNRVAVHPPGMIFWCGIIYMHHKLCWGQYQATTRFRAAEVRKVDMKMRNPKSQQHALPF